MLTGSYVVQGRLMTSWALIGFILMITKAVQLCPGAIRRHRAGREANGSGEFLYTQAYCMEYPHVHLPRQPPTDTHPEGHIRSVPISTFQTESHESVHIGFLSVFHPEGRVYCEEVSLNFPQPQAALSLLVLVF